MNSATQKYNQYIENKLLHADSYPEQWDVQRLKYVCSFNPTKSEVNKKQEINVTFLPMENISSNNIVDLSIKKSLSEVYDGYTYFRDNDIVIAKVTPCFENGNLAIISGLCNGIGFGTTEIHVVRIANEQDRRFFFYLFQSNEFKQEGIASMYGVAGLKRIPIDFLENFKVAVPSFREQKSLSSYLDYKTSEIDSLIADKEKLITLLEEKRQAVITEAVTKGLNPDVEMKDSGVDWIGEIPEHWEEKKLARIFNIIGSGGTPLSSNSSYYDGDISWLNTGDLNDGFIENTSKKITSLALSDYSTLKEFPVNSLVVAMYGATIGKLGITKIKTTTNQACCVLAEPRNSDLKFIFYWLLANRKEIINLSHGGGQPNISQGIIKSLKVTLPPYKEQVAITLYLESKDIEIITIKKELKYQIRKLKEYRQSLIYEAVTGKIDVRDYIKSK